jgi:hypothetical protein
MKPNRLPPEILKRLPPPGPDHLSPALLESLSPTDRRELLSQVPREKFEVMVDHVVTCWAEEMAVKMTTEAWQRSLRDSIKPAVLAGTLSTLQVTKAAEHSRQVDLALRDMLAEGLDLPGDVAATTALRAYMQEAIRRDITVDPPGQPADNFSRDIGITILMTLTMVRWPYLRKSASRGSKRPSASQVVAAALNRCRIANLTHHAVVKIFDDHDKIVGRVASLMPA